MTLSLLKYLEQLEEIGIVVGESSPTSFVFSVHPRLSNKVPRWEYVVAPLEGGLVVAQVRGVTTYSLLLRKDVDYDIISRLTERMVEECKHWRVAQVITHIENLENPESSGYTRARYAIPPGTRVYLAPSELLSRIYSGTGKRLKIGHLTTRKDVEIGLVTSGFRRHVAIIAQTGAGKSYLAGVLMEELLENGATIIVLDPHADYVRLSVPNNEGWTPTLAKRVFIYRAPRSISRYADIRNVKPLSIKLNDLSLQEIFYITGIEERFVRIRYVIEQVIKNLKKREVPFSLKDLIEELEKISGQAKGWKESAIRALYYLYRLQDLDVLGDRTIDIKELLDPWRLSVIDLSGLSDRESDLIAYLILKEVFRIKSQFREEKFKYPVFLFIEEAQRFIPPPVAGSTYSGELVKRIAAEGRKFGIFLTLVTQRPSKVHPDVLSQCNSQIIMRITNPIDQKAVMESSERLGKELLDDLPSLGRGEAVIVGEVINVPAVVMVRKRRSFEGGSDIDVDGLLEDALKQAEEEEKYKNNYYRDWEEFKKRSELK